MFGGHDIGTELGADVINVLWQNNTVISGSFSLMSSQHNQLSNIKYIGNTIESPGTEQFVKVGSDFRNTINPNKADLNVRFENLSVGKVWRPGIANLSERDPGILIAGNAGTTQHIEFHNLRVEGHCITSVQDLIARGYNPYISVDSSANSSVTFTHTANCTDGGDTSEPGDVDNDGDVDRTDYDTILQQFGSTNCSVNLNNSCLIDIFDYSEVVENF